MLLSKFYLVVINCIFVLLSSKVLAAKREPLNTKTFKKVALLIASTKGLAQSSFGHAYLRLSSNERWTDDDIAVEFAAEIKDDKINFFKGIGLWENYKFASNIYPYKVIKEYHTIFENRTLTTYPLSLSQMQVEKLVESLNNVTSYIDKEYYSFFTNNCATQVTKVLDDVLNSENSFELNIPIYLKDKYARFINWDAVIIDNSSSESRLKLIEKSLPHFINQSDNIFLKNIKNQLISENIKDRYLAVLKLIKIDTFNYNELQRREIFIFLNIYSLLERRDHRLEMLKIINSKKKFKNGVLKLIPLTQNMEQLEIDPQGATRFDADDQFLIREKLFLESHYSTEYIDPNKKGQYFRDKKMVDLTNYGFSSSNNQIYYNGNKIAIQPSSNLLGIKEINNNSVFFSEIVSSEDRRWLIPYILVYLEDKSSLEPLEVNLSVSNIIGINNFRYLGVGSCLSLVLTEKAILEQVVFAKDLQRLPLQENAILLEKVIAGEFVIVPGYSNVYDWTQGIGEKKLKTILGGYQVKLNQFLDLSFKFFTRTKLTATHFHDIETLLQLGLTIPIRFRNMATSERVDHVILVTGLSDQGDYYGLTVYDPNFGVMSTQNGSFIHKINKRTGVYHSTLYAKDGVSVYIDDLNVNKSFLFMNQKKRTDLQSVITQSVKNSKYNYTLEEMGKLIF